MAPTTLAKAMLLSSTTMIDSPMFTAMIACDTEQPVMYHNIEGKKRECACARGFGVGF